MYRQIEHRSNIYRVTPVEGLTTIDRPLSDIATWVSPVLIMLDNCPSQYQVYMSIYLLIFLSICLSIYLSIYLSICLSIIYLSTSVCPSIYISIRILIRIDRQKDRWIDQTYIEHIQKMYAVTTSVRFRTLRRGPRPSSPCSTIVRPSTWYIYRYIYI